MNDKQPSGPLFHKPPGIVAGKNILYALLFLKIITWAIARWSAQSYPVSTVGAVAILVVTFAIPFALIKGVTQGIKWARLVLLLWFLAELIFFYWFFVRLSAVTMLVAVLILLQVILEVIALRFLFIRESTLWFDRIKEKEQDEPLDGSVRR